MYSQLTFASLPQRRRPRATPTRAPRPWSLQIREIRLRIERSRRRPSHQLRRLERAAPAVDVLAQPLAQRAELAALRTARRSRRARSSPAPTAARRSRSRAHTSGSSRSSGPTSGRPAGRRRRRSGARRRGTRGASRRTPPAGRRESSSPESIARSSSKRRMMWSEYVTSSASTRITPGATLLSARWNSPAESSASCSGKISCSRG